MQQRRGIERPPTGYRVPYGASALARRHSADGPCARVLPARGAGARRHPRRTRPGDARQALPTAGRECASLVVALLVLTRAIHTEGFLDSCDGLFGGYSRERRLEILRDSSRRRFRGARRREPAAPEVESRIAGLPDGERDRPPGAVPMSLAARDAGMTMEAFPYAREHGTRRSVRGWAQQVADRCSDSQRPPEQAGCCSGFAGLILLGTVCPHVALALGRWTTGLLGGMTGDTYGAVNEVGEVVALLAGIVLFHFAAGLFQAPLWGMQ